MLVKNIQISNFLCYYGENRFDFVEGLNIVLGANGYGKSKLYDAFQWIFHNGITDSSPQATGLRSTRLAKGELVSEKAQHECAEDSTVKAKVVLEVVDNRGKGYQLVRSYIMRRGQDKWQYPEDSAFEILSREVTHFKPVSESQHATILESLIPTDVRPYVWFQGERGINNLIDTSSEDSLRQVIKRLSNIDRWDNYIKVSQKAFETAQSAFDNALKKSNRNQNKINDLQLERGTLEKEVKQLSEYIDQMSNNLNAASIKHEAFKVGIEYAEKIKELENTLKSQKANYEVISKRLDAQTEGLTENLFSNYWALLGTASWIDAFEEKIGIYNQHVAEQKALENITKKIEERIQTRLPQGIPEPVYVKQMLKEERCLVCNQPTPEGSEGYKAILELLPSALEEQQEAPKFRLQNFFQRLYSDSLALKKPIKTSKKSIKGAFEKMNELKQSKSLLDEELETQDREIRDIIRISGVTNSSDVINSMYGATSDISKYSADVATYTEKRKQKQIRLQEIREELNTLSQGEVPDFLVKRKDLLQDLMELCKKMKSQKYQELVDALEETANSHYKNINSPTGAFYGAIKFVKTINGGYRPVIIDSNEREVGNLNTSLVSSLKLSIILATVSTNKQRNEASRYPLISDAPVSDFDIAKTKAFLKETANTFSQSIIIMKELLVEDPKRKDRYSPDVDRLRELKDELADKNLNVYQLDMKDDATNKFRNELEVQIKKVDC